MGQVRQKMVEQKTEPNAAQASDDVRVQLMPFDLNFDGEAKVAEFFESTVRQVDADGNVKMPKTVDEKSSGIETQTIKVENGEEERESDSYTLNAAFRGRILNGKKMALPEGYEVRDVTCHMGMSEQYFCELSF